MFWSPLIGLSTTNTVWTSIIVYGSGIIFNNAGCGSLSWFFILVLEVDTLCVLSMVRDQFVGCAYGHHNVIIGG